MDYNIDLMAPNNGRIAEDTLPPLTQPRVFRLSQTAGPLPQTVLWGSAHDAPATLSTCHAGITRALAGHKTNEFTWWSGMLERHLNHLVTGYMEGCRTAQHWNLMEIARVHWYAFAVKMRLRGARHFPAIWSGAGRPLAALQLIHSS
jgi:hypothetical protein